MQTKDDWEHPRAHTVVQSHVDHVFSYTSSNAETVCVQGSKTPEEVEEAHLRWALTGNLNTGLMPAADAHTMAIGGFARDLFRVMGDRKVPRAPYITIKRKLQPPPHCAPALPQGRGTQHVSPIVDSTEQ